VVASLINEVLAAPADAANHARVRDAVHALTRRFPLYAPTA